MYDSTERRKKSPFLVNVMPDINLVHQKDFSFSFYILQGF